MNSPEKKFTAIEVLYRDAGNYKTWQTYIVEGEVTLERFAPYLEVDSLFIGQDVGIKNLMFQDREWPVDSDDHPWLELTEVRPATPAEALQAEEENRFLGTAEDVLQRFKTASEAKWPGEKEVTERIELARDETEGTEARFIPGDQSGDDSMDQALRAIRSHRRRLQAEGISEAQIDEIFGAALDKFGRDKLTLRNVTEIAATALQAEVDSLPRFREATDPAVLERVQRIPSKE
jgi:hypothetical protein